MSLQITIFIGDDGFNGSLVFNGGDPIAFGGEGTKPQDIFPFIATVIEAETPDRCDLDETPLVSRIEDDDLPEDDDEYLPFNENRFPAGYFDLEP